MNRALPLYVPDHVRNRVFRRYGDHHVHMICQQMSLFDPALLLFGKLMEYLPEVLSQLAVQHLSPALRYEYQWYLHSHFVWLKLSYSSIVKTPFRVLGGSHPESSGGLPELSNFYCHPGKAGGSPVFV